jgi:hypothetical protein
VDADSLPVYSKRRRPAWHRLNQSETCIGELHYLARLDSARSSQLAFAGARRESKGVRKERRRAWWRKSPAAAGSAAGRQCACMHVSMAGMYSLARTHAHARVGRGRAKGIGLVARQGEQTGRHGTCMQGGGSTVVAWPWRAAAGGLSFCHAPIAPISSGRLSVRVACLPTGRRPIMAPEDRWSGARRRVLGRGLMGEGVQSCREQCPCPHGFCGWDGDIPAAASHHTMMLV